VLTSADPRDALRQLSRALDGLFRKTARRAGLAWLATLPARDLAALDNVARCDVGYEGPPIRVRPDPAEPTGLGAVLASLYYDGRVRERALPHLPADLAARFLALRTADHVPQIRERARELLFGLPPEPLAMEVLLLARRHPSGTSPVYDYASRLTLDQLATLRAVTDRDQRRWAFQHSLAAGTLALAELKAGALDSDQWIRSRCADALAQRAGPDLAPVLITSQYADTRLAAMLRLPDELLSDAQVEEALFDRSARVRELAQWRSRRRGTDPRTTYVDLAAESEVPADRRLGLIWGLSETCVPDGLPPLTRYLADERPRVRLAAVRAVDKWLLDDSERARQLGPMLLDPAAKVARAAASALARLPRALTAEFTEAAWASDQPWSVRAAARAEFGASAFYIREAVLRAVDTADLDLARAARRTVPSWFPRPWNGRPLPADQQARIHRQMLAAGLDDALIDRIGFYAGLSVRERSRGSRRPR
jgi:hypothetical protein